jgi:ABC-type dipeptide/oligopeptide/nickel transport system permease component
MSVSLSILFRIVEMHLVYHMVMLYLTFEEPLKYFPQQLSFIFPQTVHKGSSFSTSSSSSSLFLSLAFSLSVSHMVVILMFLQCHPMVIFSLIYIKRVWAYWPFVYFHWRISMPAFWLGLWCTFMHNYLKFCWHSLNFSLFLLPLSSSLFF